MQSIDDIVTTMQRRLPDMHESSGLPGVQVAVGHAGEVVWSEGFGSADLVANRPMTAETTGPSGSMGKVITATAVMQLVEQGRIALDSEVADLVGFPIDNPKGGGPITVGHLLTHTSGLTKNGAGCTFGEPRPLADHLRDGFARGEHEYYGGALPKWSRPVGAEAEYSNTGMGLLGLIVERQNAEGASFSDQVARHVLAPLGMTSTVFPAIQDAARVPSELWERRSTGYAGFGHLKVRTPLINFSEYPAGNATTTAADLCRLVLAHLGEGRHGDNRVLGPEVTRAMQQNRTGRRRPHNGMDFGLMWMLHDPLPDEEPHPYFGPEPFLFHGGAHMWGWSGALRAYPSLDLVVVTLSNQWSMLDGARPELDDLQLTVPDLASAAARKAIHLPRASTEADHDLGWKASYVAGLVLGERTFGLMGVTDGLTDDHLADIVDGTHASGPMADRWDPAGFRRGMRDIEAADHTHEGIAAFMASEDLAVAPDEIGIAWRLLGGQGTPLLPLPADQ